MTMSDGRKSREDLHSPIFDQMSLWQILQSKQGRTVMVHYDQSVSTIIPFQGINNTSFGDREYNEMFARIRKLIDDIGDTSVTIQFVMMRDNNVISLDSSNFKTYIRPRVDYLKNLAENYQLFENNFYIGIFCANKDSKKNLSLLQKVKTKLFKEKLSLDVYKRNSVGLKDRFMNLTIITDAVTDLLNEIGANYRVLREADEFYSILQKFTRPSKHKREIIPILQRKDIAESPRQQLFSGCTVDFKRESFTLDDVYHKVYSLDRVPRDTVYGTTIEAIENVPFEFIYSISFRVRTTEESSRILQFKVAEKEIQEGSNKDSLMPDRMKAAETQRISDAYDVLVDAKGVGVAASMNFVLRVHESFIEKMMRTSDMSREEILRKLDQDAYKVFSKYGSSEWSSEQNTQWAVFNKIIPGMSNINDEQEVLREIFLVSDDIPYALALYENRNNLVHNGANHFLDMRGNKLVFDLMDPNLPAWNYSISGQTGSGKSVLMNAILTMQFADMTKSSEGPVICILDVGGDRGSYKKFMNLVKGTEINLSGAVKPRIQVLELVPERSLPTPDKIKSICQEFLKKFPNYEDEDKIEIIVRSYFDELLRVGVNNLTPYKQEKLFEDSFGVPYVEGIESIFVLKPGECEPSLRNYNLIMAFFDIILSSNDSEIDGFRVFEKDTIGIYVKEIYRRTKGRYPYLSDFYNMVLENIQKNSVDGKLSSIDSKLLNKLMTYTRNGAKPMFDLDSNINLDNDVILADMKGLEGDKQLQAIYTLLISESFNNKMYFTKDRRKLIVRDEAWSLMGNDLARRYFEEDLRTARKNGFATVALSQLPTDYLKPDPEIGRAIMSNMQVNILCKFESGPICERIGVELGLNDKMVEEMKTLGVKKVTQPDGSVRAEYSTFMMIVGKSVYILRNQLHPFEYALYSSSADDNAIIDYFVENENLSLEEALWIFARGQHVGNMELAEFLERAGHKNKALEVRGKKKR